MGVIESLKERIAAKRAFGSVSEKADIGVDVPRTESNTKDDLFESRDERRTRNQAKAREVYGKVQTGFEKFERGKKQAGEFLQGLGAMLPAESSSSRKSSGKTRRKSSSGGFSFGISDQDIMAMSGFGPRSRSGGRQPKNMFDIDLSFGGSSSDGRKRSSGAKEVPIYRGRRIVGYRRTASNKARKKPKSIFDIDLGF